MNFSLKFKPLIIVLLASVSPESFPAPPTYIMHSTEAQIPFGGNFDQSANGLNFLTWTVGNQSREDLPYNGKIYGAYAGSTISYKQLDAAGDITVTQSVRPGHGVSAAVNMRLWGNETGGGIELLSIRNPAISARLECNNPWGNCRGGTYNINFTPWGPTPGFSTSKVYDSFTLEYTSVVRQADVPFVFDFNVDARLRVDHYYKPVESEAFRQKMMGVRALDVIEGVQYWNDKASSVLDVLEVGRIFKGAANMEGVVLNDEFRAYARKKVNEAAVAQALDESYLDFLGGRSESTFINGVVSKVTEKITDYIFDQGQDFNPLGKRAETYLFVGDLGLYALRAGANWLVNDPADPDYKKIFDPYSTFDSNAFSFGDVYVDAYVKNSLLAASAIAGMVVANERYLGALEMNDVDWAVRQFEESERNYVLSREFSGKAVDAQLALLNAIDGEALIFDGFSFEDYASAILDVQSVLERAELTAEERSVIERILASADMGKFDPSLTYRDLLLTNSAVHNTWFATAIPEPRTSALFMAGLFLVLLVSFRKLTPRESRFTGSRV